MSIENMLEEIKEIEIKLCNPDLGLIERSELEIALIAIQDSTIKALLKKVRK